MTENENEFYRAIRRQVAASDSAMFYIVQEKSSNVLKDLTVKDTDGKEYEIKSSDAADRHREMLIEQDLIFQYIPGDLYVFYRRREAQDDPSPYIIPKRME